MKVMGIDLGIRKAAFSVVADGILTETHAYESTADRTPMQLRDVASWVYDAVCSVEPDYIFIEEPLIGNNRKYSLNIAKMFGAVLADLAWLDDGSHISQVVPVNVSHWKKGTTGKGNATKELVRQWLFSLNTAYPGLCGDDQDRIDSAVIGLYGYNLTQFTGSLVSDAG